VRKWVIALLWVSWVPQHPVINIAHSSDFPLDLSFLYDTYSPYGMKKIKELEN
jgi:hypothetical protein